MKSRILCILMCICMIFASAPVSVYAEAAATGAAIIEEINEAAEMDETMASQEEWTKKAEAALQALAEKKTILASVYLSDIYEIKEQPSKNSKTAGKAASGQTVKITGFAVSGGAIWYQAKPLSDGADYQGYVEKKYLAYSDEEFIAWENTYLPHIIKNFANSASGTGYEDIEAFPASYKGALYELKQKFPKWTFVKMNTDFEWNKLIQMQRNPKEISLISSSSKEAWRDGNYSSGWDYASEEAVKYFIDPRNFLKESGIFQFELLTYNETYHTQEAVQKFLASSFMSGKIPDADMTYAQAFCSIGDKYGLSPFHLASRVYQEQGKNGSVLVSGEGYKGQYIGYYNFFNVGASGSSNEEVILNGLKTAAERGWNTRLLSLDGGAATIGRNYILKGQDTVYLEKFDVVKNDGNLHQYMQNVAAPYSEAQNMKKLYEQSDALDNTFVFKIPVYQNMPAFPTETEGQELKMEAEQYNLNMGESRTMEVYLGGQKQDNRMFGWQSSQPEIASVSAEGVVKANETGTAVITASAGERQVSCTVTVAVPLVSIRLNKETLTLNKNQQELLQVIYEPENTTDDKTVVWSSSDNKVVTVEDGMVKAAGKGSAVVTAKAGDHTAQCLIDVLVPLETVRISDPVLSLYRGESRELEVYYEPYDTTEDTSVIWGSSDRDIASVENGVVRAVSDGTAVITATMAGIGVKCEVTVASCVLTFEMEDGNRETMSLGYGETAKVLPVPAEQEGRFFIGWFTKAEGGGSEFTENTVVTQSMTLYPYFMESGKGMFILPIGEQEYTGAAIKPGVLVYDKDKRLSEGIDYTISYKNNTKVNDASVERTAPTVLIKGKGNYSGTETAAFKIMPKNLTDDGISAEAVTAAYTGRTMEIVPQITWNTKKLKNKKDFMVSYPSEGAGAYKEPGNYEILVTGIGNFTGTRKVKLEITNKMLLSKAKTSKIANQPYQGGKEITPSFVLKIGSYVLEENTDYTVSCLDNREIGTAQIIVSGKGNFAGTKKIPFKITGTPVSKTIFGGFVSREYSGAEIRQDIRLNDRVTGAALKEDVDFTAEYSKNIKKGTATVLITGKGAYSGTMKKTFRILPYSIEENTEKWIEIEELKGEVPYEKGGSRPKITVSFRGTVLKEGTDYTLSYKNNTAVTNGTDGKIPTLTIKGKGNFIGSISKTFQIVKQDFGAVKMTAEDAVFREKQNNFRVNPVFYDNNGKKLTAGKDYDKNYSYTYASETELPGGVVKVSGAAVEDLTIVPVGTRIRVSAEGRGNYTETENSTVYQIVPASIAKAKVSVAKQYYTGSEIHLKKEDILVKAGSAVLQPTDYEIEEDSYENHIEKGKASVVIRGTGSYGGSKKVTFQIISKPINWWWNLKSLFHSLNK